VSAPLLTIHNRHPAACGIPPALSTEVADLYIATSERAGLPTVQVSTMTPVAVMVGANRIVAAAGIIHPLGNAELSPAEEKALRRRIVESALRALATEVVAPTVFAPDDPTAGARASEPPRP